MKSSLLQRLSKDESGSSLIEYVVLVAFLSVALVGVLHTTSSGIAEKLCFASGKTGDFNKDGSVDRQDYIIFMGEQNHERTDLNCNGKGAFDEAYVNGQFMGASRDQEIFTEQLNSR